MVNGYQGAIYKSFYNQADAKNYLKANLIPNQNITNTIYCAYVDGSYDKKNPNICGAGAVILKQNKIIKKISKKFANDFCGNNVIGEIYSVLAVLQYCQSYKIKNIAIYHDYQGLSA
jgi:ribonuclease HI